MVKYLQKALLPSLKLLPGEDGGKFSFPGFIHVHVLPFIFLGPRVILIWVELEQFSIVFL